ncbi:MAG: hypothetical protein HQL70_08640 [Magnetococcales bacterium]|nr:hypothetical protein [Magnetococcales bacterium]
MVTQKIHQLQLAYSSEEDRLLLRFNTTDGVEFRFWLTRLFVQKFWPGFVRILEVQARQQSSNNQDQNEAVNDKVVGFMHQAAVAKANFTEKFETVDSKCPLGNSPVLVCKATIQKREGDTYILSFHPEKGYGVELGVDQNLLHMLGKMITDTVAQIDWALAIKIPGVSVESSSIFDDASAVGRRLH